MSPDQYMKAAGIAQKYEDVDVYWPSCPQKNMRRLVIFPIRQGRVRTLWPWEPGVGESIWILRTAIRLE